MHRVVMSVVLIFVAGARADWFRDFNSGTPQGLLLVDFAGDAYVVTAAGGGLRFKSKNNHTENDSIIAVDFEQFAATSARLLIRYSTNPALGTSEPKMNGGILIRGDLVKKSGYLLVMNDFGFLQMYEVFNGVPDEQNHFGGCTTWGLQDVPSFTASSDWWMRFEAENDGAVVRLRGRVWLDGTAEPCDWMVACTDTSGTYNTGVVALVVNEDKNGHFLDLDNASASSELTCRETCDNNVDDNNDGLVDCRDPQCAAAPACECHMLFADTDDDGDVDLDDFGEFQLCYTGRGGTIGSTRCGCFDRDDSNSNGVYDRAADGDGDVDEDDLARFLQCVTRASVPSVCAE